MFGVLKQALTLLPKGYHVPCLAHVIQLAVKELLSSIQAQASNDDFVKHWSDDLKSQVPIRQGFLRTMEKVRKIAVHVNASPQRAEKFERIQQPFKLRLKLLQDVKTRWNSTLIMLIRFVRLEGPVTRWMEDEEDAADIIDLALEPEEWTQIKYIIQLTKPFALHGYTMGNSEFPTVQHVFVAYNALFDHLDAETTRLNKKTKAWKRELLPAIQAAKDKLAQYYSQTDKEKGRIFNLATILNPVQKLRFYEQSNWEPSWKQRYQAEFEDHFKIFYERNIDGELIRPLPLHKSLSLDHLAQRSRSDRAKKANRRSVPQTGDVMARCHYRGLEQCDRWPGMP
ncbi:MAG: hypothetical protein M1816_004119 [Peltula sp. TS41687]|nr:MAG: hypothetical protein M1816_004119 [Peltula sp. TS41687]